MSHLLNLPTEIRLRVLQYAVPLERTIICTLSECYPPPVKPQLYSTYLGPPPRGFPANPHLYLRLICSQITREMAAIDLPRLQIQVCCGSCVSEYFRKWPDMKDRVESAKVPYHRDSDTAGIEVWKTLFWIDSGAMWFSYVDFVETGTLPSGSKMLVEGKAIFNRSCGDCHGGLQPNTTRYYGGKAACKQCAQQ